MEPRKSDVSAETRVTLPVGELVNTTPAKRPQPVRLTGQFVDVAPLDALAHANALWERSSGVENHGLYAYLFQGPFAEREDFEAHIVASAASRDPLFFAVEDKHSGQAVGHATLMRIEPVHRVIEVGNILFTPALQRSPGATEAMYLMAKHVFEDLGYRRYEWKCNALNEPSRRAALRYGFEFEGIFRQHMIVKGRSRDTAWYAMLDSEWPACKRAFEAWLDPSNFDATGQQKQRLAELRDASRG